MQIKHIKYSKRYLLLHLQLSISLICTNTKININFVNKIKLKLLT